MTIAGILLAGGRSERFGSGDKLLAPFLSKPLVTYAAEALRACDLDLLIAVVANEFVAENLAGFQIATPSRPSHTQSDSLRVGVGLAEDLGADQVIVVLGDMPNITTRLIQDVMGLCRAGAPSAAFDGHRAIPPACFTRESFADIHNLVGDQGARSILRRLPMEALVRAPDGELIDIDTPNDMLKAAAARGN